MTPVTVETTAGPIMVAREGGNPDRPVHVLLGKGIFSVTAFLTAGQALRIAEALTQAANGGAQALEV